MWHRGNLPQFDVIAMSDGIDVWMIFQVVAATEDAATESLAEHIEKLREEDAVVAIETEKDEAQEVAKPHPQLDKGYSQVCEATLTVKRFDSLVDIVINYGPTSVDVKGPETRKMDVGEMRDSLNAVAQMMHEYVKAGPGGVMISRNRD